jgi:hypothetical protein
MKSIMGTKSIVVFVFSLLLSLPVNADFKEQEEIVNSFETNIFRDGFNKNERLPSGSSSDDDPNEDEDWIGKPEPVGDAVWLIVALGFIYGIYTFKKNCSHRFSFCFSRTSKKN